MACRALVLSVAVAILAGCTGSASSSTASSSTAPSAAAPSARAVGGVGTVRTVPRFAHIVVVVEENRAYADIIGSPDAPYINRLARTGALLTHYYAVAHPSEPNYLALFSGSTHGLTDDSCPHRYAGGNLAAQLLAHGDSFVGYAQSLPRAGYPGCSYRAYARKHAPWTNFSNVPTWVGQPMRAFPTDYDLLPRLAFVIPDLIHDMHDGTVARGDAWLRRHLAGYVRWARTHNSLLIVTWDEDDRTADNHVPGVLAGAHVNRMRYGGRVDHYRLLRTVEAACGLPAVGAAARRVPIRAVWSS